MKLVFIRNLNYIQKQQSIEMSRITENVIVRRYISGVRVDASAIRQWLLPKSVYVYTVCACACACVLAADPAETHRYLSLLVFLLVWVPYSHFCVFFFEGAWASSV